MFVLAWNLPLYATILISVAIVVVLLGVFILTFILNKKTKAPDNCPKETIGCAGCMLNCGVREEDLSISKVTSNLTENFHGSSKGEEEKKKEAEPSKDADSSKEEK
ncbi:MAG: hypothetical protein LKJ88_08085 [Bacilli bacterium]|jgi:flagellar basal body-associated protein FliL|nr:hypothetical protein [Bacilli bacterium]